MAKFYPLDIPKTPAARGEPQGADVPVGPYRNTAKPAQYEGIDAKVQNIDIAKNIPSLMQKELPENLQKALVGGQLAVGKAWGNTAESFANLAETTGRIAAHMQRNKDAADQSRVRNLMNTFDMAFAEKAANEKWTLKDQLEIAPSWHQKLDEDIGKLGLSRDNAEQAKADLYLHHAKHRTELTHKMRLEEDESNKAAIDTDRRSAIDKGDIEGANAAVERAYDAQLINKGQRQKLLQENRVGYDEWKALTDITESGSVPSVVIDHLDKAIANGKSDWYPNLNLKQLHDLRHNAKVEYDRRESDKIDQIGNGIADGSIKSTEDVENLAAGEVDALKIKKINEYFTDPKPVEYSQEAMAIVEGAIATYEKEAPGSGSPNFYAIHDMIMKTTPKEEHEDLYQRLKEKRDKDPNALPGEDWFNALPKDIEQMRKDGSFAGPRKPPMYIFGIGFGGGQEKIDMTQVNKGDTDPVARQYRLTHRAEIEEMNKKARSIQIELQKWRKANPGNDQKTQDEAYKFRDNLLKSTSAEAGLVPIQQKTRPQAPGTKNLGGPDLTSSATKKNWYATEEDEKKYGGLPAPTGILNESLISSVKQFEGFEPVSKWDFKQYSVGYGTRGSKGESLTEEQAHDRLVAELESHAGNIDDAAKQVGLSLTENERNALISFDFNTGKGDELITSSGGDKAEILRRLQLYTKAGGKTNPGLVNRRRAEARMFQGLA